MGRPPDTLGWSVGNSRGEGIKCKGVQVEFAMKEILYLGHVIGHDGV